MISAALVGLGAIGQNAHLPALLRSADVTVTAVADPVPDRHEQVRSQLPAGTPLLQDLDQVLELPDVDVVVLATPPWVTPDLAVRAARSGRAVLVEKPIATSSVAAGTYDALTTAERGRVQVGLTYRHDPALAHLRGLIADGALGTPLLVRAHIYDEARTDDQDHARLIEDTLQHGSPVIHEGAHVFDWLTYLLGGAPEIADAWSMATRTGLGQDNVTGARLDYRDGTVALVEFGWLTARLPRCELTFLGDRGLATLEGQAFDLEVAIDGEAAQQITFPGDRGTRCFDLQVQRLVDLVSGRCPLADPGLDAGLAALKLSEEVAARASVAGVETGRTLGPKMTSTRELYR